MSLTNNKQNEINNSDSPLEFKNTQTDKFNVYYKIKTRNLQLNFKNQIIKILSHDAYDINENFITKFIRNDRDKDILSTKQDIDSLITCKYMKKGLVNFADIERTANTSKNYDVQGFIVTNTGYSKKAKDYVSKNDILLTHSHNILYKLNFYVDRKIGEKKLDILYDILE
ncbi:hypothetical protein C2G38_2030252 [Gigaspora rosea]|uniref:Restriction endonuclease type IV Mrr domain-containing protein n=1 Tax=Gigaspora rosea TaxID=44941 RepID=A0A397VUX5_9GLOM|nr:hypothetical protein C2G38_2030252 [Gigaspora rosea]